MITLASSLGTSSLSNNLEMKSLDSLGLHLTTYQLAPTHQIHA